MPGYASIISTIDGATNFWGTKSRGDMVDLFRGISLGWSAEIEQSLPAKVIADLAQRSDFVALSKDLMSLGKRLKLLAKEDEIKTLCN